MEVPVMLSFTYFCNYMEPKLVERVSNCATLCPSMKIGCCCCPSGGDGGGGGGDGEVDNSHDIGTGDDIMIA